MRDLLTTVLDIVGAVLLVVALAILAAELEVTAWVRALGVAGVGLLFVSWLGSWLSRGAPLPWKRGRA